MREINIKIVLRIAGDKSKDNDEGDKCKYKSD